MKKTTMMIGAAAAALAYFMTRKGGAMAGLGEIDPGSPEYMQWYYNTYLPYIQQQGQTSYQYGNYGQRPGYNPYQPYQQPYQQPYGAGYGQSPQQCGQSGGFWDSFTASCSTGTGAQPVTPVAQQPYNPYQYQWASPVVTANLLIGQGLSSGLIFIIKQGRPGKLYSTAIFADAATGKHKMNWKAAAAYVQKMGGQSMVSYQPAINPGYQQGQVFQAQTPQSQAMNLPFATAGMPSVETQDISWAIDGGGGAY